MSFLTVIGGISAATMINFPMFGIFVALPVGLKTAFANEKDSPRDNIKPRNSFSMPGFGLRAFGRELPNIQNFLKQEKAQFIQRE